MTMQHPRVDVLRSKDGGRYFRIKSTNGSILCTSETYLRLKWCLNGAARATQVPGIAALKAGDQTTVGRGARKYAVLVER